MTNTLQLIPVDQIDPHPQNPRRDLGDLTELVESIREQGIRQNLLLVPHDDDLAGYRADGDTGGAHAPQRYRAVIGHRRLRAAQLAGLVAVPAVVDPSLTDADQMELMLLENVQRTNLSPMEEAEGYQGLLDLGVKVREIARRTGRNEKTVTARIRLMKLPAQTREKVHLHQATLEDAADMAAFTGHPKLLAKLDGAIGTSNWRWVLEDAKRERRTEEVRKILTAELKKLGIPHHTSDGYAYDDYRSVAHLSAVKDLDKAKQAGIPEGTVYIRNYSGLELIRPTTEDERSGKSSRDAKWEADQAHRAAIDAEGEAAAELRSQFIRDLMGKRLTAKQVAAITAGTLPAAIASYTPSAWQIEHWAGIPSKRTDELTAALTAAFPGADPVCWLLVELHTRIPTTWGWETVYNKPDAIALYGVLEQLGYPISDAERARLTPPAAESDDDEDGAEDA